MHRDKIQPQRMHAACRIVTWGSCCTKRFAEFNGNCESYCSLEQLVASLCAAHEGKPASGTYHSKTEGYTRRNFYRPPGLLYCEECIWTRIRRQPVKVITWHFTQHTLLEPLTVTGASAFCLGERYRDVLSQNLDENNSTQTSPDCCTYVNNSVTVRVCLCATYSLLGTPAYMLYQYVGMRNQILLCRQQREEPTKRRVEYGTANETSTPPMKTFVDALVQLPKHNNRPSCPRPSTVAASSQLGDTRAVFT